MKMFTKIIVAAALTAGASSAFADVSCQTVNPKAYVTGVALGSKSGFITSRTYTLNSAANGAGTPRGTISINGVAGQKLSTGDDLGNLVAQLEASILTGQKLGLVNTQTGNVSISIAGATACTNNTALSGSQTTNITVNSGYSGSWTQFYFSK